MIQKIANKIELYLDNYCSKIINQFDKNEELFLFNLEIIKTESSFLFNNLFYFPDIIKSLTLNSLRKKYRKISLTNIINKEGNFNSFINIRQKFKLDLINCYMFNLLLQLNNYLNKKQEQFMFNILHGSFYEKEAIILPTNTINLKENLEYIVEKINLKKLNDNTLHLFSYMPFKLLKEKKIEKNESLIERLSLLSYENDKELILVEKIKKEKYNFLESYYFIIRKLKDINQNCCYLIIIETNDKYYFDLLYQHKKISLKRFNEILKNKNQLIKTSDDLIYYCKDINNFKTYELLYTHLYLEKIK